MALQKALLFSLFSLFVLSNAARAFLETDPSNLKDLTSQSDEESDLISKAEAVVDSAVNAVKAAQPPVADSPTRSVPVSLDQVEAGIKEICGSTDYPSECIEAIAPFLNGKSDPVSVVKFAINGVIEHTKEAIVEARRMSKEARSPAVATIVNEIRESYEDALENFQSAMEAINEQDIGTANSMLSAAITDFSDNDDKLSGRAGTLVKYDDKLSKMTSNCLAITSLIN